MNFNDAALKEAAEALLDVTSAGKPYTHVEAFRYEGQWNTVQLHVKPLKSSSALEVRIILPWRQEG